MKRNFLKNNFSRHSLRCSVVSYVSQYSWETGTIKSYSIKEGRREDYEIYIGTMIK